MEALLVKEVNFNLINWLATTTTTKKKYIYIGIKRSKVSDDDAPPEMVIAAHIYFLFSRHSAGQLEVPKHRALTFCQSTFLYIRVLFFIFFFFQHHAQQ